jgi:ATP-dependent Clp protease, protease subunit
MAKDDQYFDVDITFDKELVERGIFILKGVIDTDNSSEAIEFILKHNLRHYKKRVENITLIVNSSGGELPAAFALIDIMRGSKIPVHTLGLGEISSAGLLIFMAGKKGYRTITPNTSILSHQYSWGSEGKEHELIAIIKEFNLTSDRMLNHYIKCTGLKQDVIKKVLMPPQDVFLDAKEAVKYNIADKIVNTYL